MPASQLPSSSRSEVKDRKKYILEGIMAKSVKDVSTYNTMAGEGGNGSSSKGADRDTESTQSPDVENAFIAPLHRRLKSRHLTMIAIGGML